MKKLFIFCLMTLLFSINSFSQADKIFLHNGKVVEGSVVRVAEFTVVYKFIGEDVEQVLGKYAVGKIIYFKSGREEVITEKIVLKSKKDWERVVVLQEESQTVGLQKVAELTGKTGLFSGLSAHAVMEKVAKSLQKEAAEKGCPIVLTKNKAQGAAYKY